MKKLMYLLPIFILLFYFINVVKPMHVEPSSKPFESRHTNKQSDCKKYGLKEELHLIILWENARNKQSEILKDLQKSPLVILECIDMVWPEDKVIDNFSRLYEFSKNAALTKREEAGSGHFLIITLLDRKPVYRISTLTNGISECNNYNLFQKKQKYRSWTKGKGGWLVHATASPAETEHDMRLLLGKGYDEYLEKAPKFWDRKIHYFPPQTLNQ